MTLLEDLYERAYRLTEVLRDSIVQKETKIEDILYLACDYKKNNVLPQTSEMKYFEGVWGGRRDSHAWFSFNVDVEEYPDCYAELLVETNQDGWDASNPQFLAYIDGKIVQGVDVNHRSFLLEKGKHSICLYAYTGTNIDDKLSLKVKIVYINIQAEGLYYDVTVPQEIFAFTSNDKKEYADTLMIINEAYRKVEFIQPKTQCFYESCKEAREWFQKEFYLGYCDKGRVSVSCIGHTHIDVAWMWTVRQTREKAQRSFATVLALMDRYPEYKFMSSQAYLYEAVKEEAPELYERIKQRVKEGRWEVEGAMWVEADCNLISGESLVRQILLGKQFFKEEFDVDSKILWLPDVFGYSAAMPQILRKSGVDTFVTSKISWNDTNQIPYDIFDWYGIDGTPVFSYFLTAQDMPKDGKAVRYATYVATGNARQVAGTYHRMQQKEFADEALITYGWGDGGGGPTKGYIENIKRLQYGVPNVPTAKFESAGEFLERTEKKARESGRLPKWRGELYLEFHRGTYTTIAKNKKNNRKAEFLMQNIENYSVLSYELLGEKIPTEWLKKNWKMVLTNQFHDIIPGSSITEVYDITDKEYATFFEEGNALLDLYMQKLADTLGGEYTVFNPNGFTANGYVETDGEYRYVMGIPSKGFKAVVPAKPKNTVCLSAQSIENEYLCVQFDGQYNIVSIYDKMAKREVLAGTAKLVAFEDYPVNFDAWELRSYYKEKSYNTEFVSVTPVSYGAKKGLKIIKKICQSLIVQEICLYEDTKQISFDTTLDWQNEHLVLKAFFPLAINGNGCACDVQFGRVDRTISQNTSWDVSKFEFCAQKYVDISEGNYGVSLINDCKYGHSATDNILGLTLIRCATDPSESVDKGEHKFSYVLYPHIGTLNESETVRYAYLLNNPLRLVKGRLDKKQTDGKSLVYIDAPQVILDTVKPAEAGEGTVLRLYETGNCATDCVLKLLASDRKVYLCDLMEREIEQLTNENNCVNLHFKPFEIITVKVK